MLGAKILIIDDDRKYNEILSDFLRHRGVNTICATNGAQGVELAKQTPPDLIVCDLDMPVMDGFGVVSSLRQSSPLSEIPVIFLTNCTDPKQIRRVMNVGGDDYLQKLHAFDEIYEAIQSKLKRHQQIQHRIMERAMRTVQRFDRVVDGKKDLFFEKLPAGNSESSSQLSPPAQKTVLVSESRWKANARPEDVPGDVERKHFFVNMREIKVIKADGEYSNVFWGENQQAMIRRALKDWFKQLDPHCFFQAHRKYIINLHHVDHVQRAGHQIKIHLKNYSEIIKVSQRNRAHFNHRMKQFG